MKKIIFLLNYSLLIITVFSPKILFGYSWGMTYNNYQYMIGARAAGMGGAYTSNANDSSAIWYNPAGLANLENSTISISADTYSYYRSKTNNFLNAPTVSADDKQEDKSIVPTSFVVGNKIGSKSAYGLGIFVPAQMNLTGELYGQSITTINRIVKADYTLGKKEYVGMLGFGTEIINRLRFGISAGFSYYYGLFNLNYTHKWVNILTPTTQWHLHYETSKERSFYLMFIGSGFQFDITQNHKLGFYFQTPKWMLYGDSNAKYFRIESNYQTTLTEDKEKSDLFDEYTPWLVSLGYSFELLKKFSFSLDAIYISKIDKDDTAAHNSIVNYRAGVEFYPVSYFVIRAGFYTDFTQQADIKNDTSPHPFWLRRMDYYCGTINIAFKNDLGGGDNLWTDIGFTVRYGTGDVKTIYLEAPTWATVPHTEKTTSWNYQLFIAETIHF